MKEKFIVMLGPAFNSMGGISSVVGVYRQAGLFNRWSVVYLPTGCDGNVREKLSIAFKSFFCLFGLILKGRVSLVHIHTASYTSFYRESLFVMLSLATRRPVILHLHGGGFIRFYEENCGTVMKHYVRFILNHVSRLVVLTGQWQLLLSRITTNPHIIPVVNPVGVDTKVVSNIGRYPATILFLGKLDPGKGVFDLIEAVKRLQDDYPEIQLLFGGNGDHERVSRYAKDLGVEKSIKLLGWVTGEEKHHLLAKATMYVLPSYNEGLPMSVLEALACGLPVISTRVGGIPEAVQDGVEGYLINPGDIDALVDSMSKLLADAGLRNSMGKAAQDKVLSKFMPENVLPGLEVIYRELGAVPSEERVSE